MARPLPRPARRLVRPHVSPHGSPPARRWSTLVGAVAATLLLAWVVLVGGPGGGRAALAEVTHRQGFHATVLGWTSWYGSYGLGEAGTGWCIDHGLRAPDPAYGYVPTVVAAPVEVQRAIAWIAAQPDAGPVDAAARMLVFHDLMGATYPFGRLDVDALTVGNLAGFAGQEAAVLERARHLKAEGLARSHLRAPLGLQVWLEDVAPGAEGRVEAAVLDADGQAVPGVEVALALEGATLHGDVTGTTLGDGRARWTFTRPEDGSAVRAAADATVPRLDLSAWASSTVPAQRVAVGALDALHGTAELAPPATTTTTTAPPTTTTAPPATTSTTAPPTTTTTAPPTTTTTTTAPPSTTTTTAPPPTSTPPPVPPAAGPPPAGATPPPVPARPTLPRTGDERTRGLLAVGSGLLLGGGAALLGSRRRLDQPDH